MLTLQQSIVLNNSDPEKAEPYLEEYCKKNKYDFQLHRILGMNKIRQGKFSEAEPIFERLIKLDAVPTDYTVLSAIYTNLRDNNKAIDILHELYRRQNNFNSLDQLASKLWINNRHYDAFELLKEFKNYKTDEEWNKFAEFALKLLDLDVAKKATDAALELNPNHAASHLCLTDLYYFKNDWKNALREYEWRINKFPEYKKYFAKYPLNKMWDGKATLIDKIILVYAEQGIGDIIQFSRFIKDIPCKKIILNCPKSIAPIFTDIETISVNFMEDIVLPDFDCHVLLCSLPHLLNTNTISGKPYFKQTKNKLYSKVISFDNVKVGFTFTGSKDHKLNNIRSIPSHFFHFNNPEIQLFSLQVPTTKVEFDCVDLSKDLNNFQDTADAISGLDLLISCDSSPAHLAGALGVPTWLCLPYSPDSRWGLGEKTYWYDSIKIYRQTELGNWNTVFDKIKDDLDCFVNLRIY